MNILIIEDDLGFATLLQEALSGEPSFRAIHALTLAQGLHLSSRDAPDAILLDLKLPDAAGTEALEKVIATHPTVAVVVMTGGAEIPDESRYLQLGAQEVLLKHEDHIASVPRLLRRALARQTVIARAEQVAREERERRVRAERDLAWFDDLRSTRTAEIYGIQSSLEAVPELGDQLADLYEELLDETSRRAVFRNIPHPGPKIRAYSTELASLRAGPKEVTEIHGRVLRRMIAGETRVGHDLIRSEGRLLLIEVMGYLLSEYRLRSLGVRMSPPDAPAVSSPTSNAPHDP